MCQRTSVAEVAMVLRPQMLLRNSPAIALDVTVQKQVVEENDAGGGSTIVMVSHDMGSNFLDEIYVMLVGYIVGYKVRNNVMNHTVHQAKNLIDADSEDGKTGTPRELRMEQKRKRGLRIMKTCVYKTQRCEKEIPGHQGNRAGAAGMYKTGCDRDCSGCEVLWLAIVVQENGFGEGMEQLSVKELRKSFFSGKKEKIYRRS